MAAIQEMEHQQRWWEERAGEYYETMYITDHVKNYITGRRAGLAAKWLAAGDPWLDLGVGTGTIFAEVLRRTGSKGVGMDYTRNMLAVARRQQANRNAGFLQGNGIALPFEDEAFKVVFSVDVMHHIAFEGLHYVDQALANIRRVLRDDGVFVVYEANPLNIYWYYYMNKIGEDNARLMRRAYLEKALQRAGLEVVEGRYMGFVPQFLSARALRWFRPLESAVEATPLVQKFCSNYYLVARKAA